MTPIVVVSSPLVGAGAMSELAEALRGLGRQVAVPEVAFELATFTDCVQAACGSSSAAPVVVGYSAAGPRLFHVAGRADVAGLVFLDARLPDHDVAPDADPRFRGLLDALPTDAHHTVPPWSEWWPREVLEQLVPDPQRRATLAAGCGRPPRAMFSQPIPAPDVDAPCAFVGLGDGYAGDAEAAARLGWPVEVIPHAHHLWPVTNPAAVASAVGAMVDRLVP